MASLKNMVRFFTDRFHQARDGVKWGMGSLYKDEFVSGLPVKGEIFFDMRDARTGEILFQDHKKNLILLDAGILAAALFRDPNSRPLGLNMLAVGTGATGALLSPDAPDPRQRKLNAEIARKPFVSTVFRDANGNAVSYWTNVVDFTATFSQGEAVGPLNEMSLMATISANPNIQHPNPNNFPVRNLTVDLADFDICVNRYTFSVLSKPSTAVLTLTWRITF